jgi:hypothetical protein
MADSILWAAGIALESLILLRFLKCRLFRHFPLFFVYMAVVWISTLVLLPLYHASAYTNAFWALEFLGLLAGFGVLLELVQKSLEGYAGAKNFSTVVLAGMFAILFAYCIYKVAIAPPGTEYENFSDLERDFRAVQALAMAGFLVVISYYRIDVGKNLRGIASGFGLFVGSVVLSNALREYAGSSFNAAWEVIQPYTYFVALLIWVVALWSDAPAPPPDRTFESGGDYEILARETKKRLSAIRAEVGRAERQ